MILCLRIRLSVSYKYIHFTRIDVYFCHRVHRLCFLLVTGFLITDNSRCDVLFFFRRNGADYLGPLLPAVAEICSDLQPIQEVDSSLQKLFRNLWFYIVLYGLAPPIQKTQQHTMYSVSSSRSMSLSNRGSLNGNQVVSGPYAWNEEWLCAVKRLAQSTPPLVSRFLLPAFFVHCKLHFLVGCVRYCRT